MSSSLEQLAEELQAELARVDFLARKQSRRNLPPGSYVAELLVLRLDLIKIKIYQEKGHGLPHVHVDYGKQHHVASYSIDPVKRLEGDLHSKYEQAVTKWIESHKSNLVQLWSTLQAGKPTAELVMTLQGDA